MTPSVSLVTCSYETAAHLVCQLPEQLGAVISVVNESEQLAMTAIERGIPALALDVDDITSPSLVSKWTKPFTLEHAQLLQEFVLASVTDTTKTTLVHCSAGVSRSTAATASILAVLGATPEEAIAGAARAFVRSFTEFSDVSYGRTFSPNARILATVSYLVYGDARLLVAYFDYRNAAGKSILAQDLVWLEQAPC